MQNIEIIADLVKKARAAQERIANYTQEQIDELCLAVGWEVYCDENVARLAKRAVEETGMGRIEDKIAKHTVKVLGVLKDMRGARSVGLIERDVARGISKYAKPVGVIGALTPVTNPTVTPASNALAILKGRNAVIFGPHPRGGESCKLTVQFMRRGLAKVGAPLDLIQSIETPGSDLSGELMQQVDLVVATGGPKKVAAAYSSGTPAYGVGAGNAVQIIAEDADIVDAVDKVSLSKTFDYSTSCSSESSVVIQERVYEQALAEFKKHRAHLCTPEEKERLRRWMWVPSKKGGSGLNPQVVAQPAEVVAGGAGISVPPGTQMLLVLGGTPGKDDAFSAEKLCPVLAVWKYATLEDAIAIVTALTNYAGFGHSCGIHTFRDDYIEQLALRMKSSRIMVRQPQAPANGGNFFNGMPSAVTLGCGTWGGNITTENINYRHFLNITWVSEPIMPVRPTDEEMWGAFWKKFGKPAR